MDKRSGGVCMDFVMQGYISDLAESQTVASSPGIRAQYV